MKRYLPYAIVISVGLMTAGAGGMLYRAHRAPLITLSKRDAAGTDSKLTHIRGPADAPVTIEEYGDYQCPPCGMLAGPLKEIEEENKTKLRLIFRHFPFPIHQHAFLAACAAEAAGLQNKFWEMHDLLYREQSNWSKTSDARQLFISYAGILGLDITRFTKDIDSPDVKSRVEQDKNRATALGITNTPTLFINNQSVPPNSLNPQNLGKVVSEAIAKSEKPSSG